MMTLFAGFAWSTPLQSATTPDAVTIESSVLGRAITWKVTNRSGPPIVQVEIPAAQVYHASAPAGWRCEEFAKGIKAEADSASTAIRAGQSAEFAVKGISSGTILTEGWAIVRFKDVPPMKLYGFQTFGPERTGTILLVPLTLAALVGVHLIVFRRRIAAGGPGR